MKFIIVDDKSPCNRMYNNHSIRVYNYLFRSMEVLFWFVVLINNSNMNQAQDLAESDALRQHPIGAYTWAMGQLTLQNPETLFRGSEIFLGIVVHLLMTGNNALRHEFQRIMDMAEVMYPSPHQLSSR
mgnify:CR=1 FL=1